MKRHLGLDVLRGLAVLFVLLSHLPDGGTGAFIRWSHRSAGWVGVDLFFVLSGFLVSGLLFREHQRHGALRIGRFLVRRGLKIYPAYYVFLVVTLGWFQLVRVPVGWDQLVLQLVYLQNYGYLFYEGGVPYWGHTWTLAIEEHFYLILAAWLLLTARRDEANPFRSVPWLCGLASIVCLGLRVWMQGRTPIAYATHFNPTHLRIDSLTTGVALSYFLNYERSRTEAVLRRGWPLLVPAGVALYLGMPAAFELHETPWMFAYGPTLVAIGAVLLVGVTAVFEWPRFAPVRWFGRIGVDSYSIYLWHVVLVGGQGLLIALLAKLGVPGGMPLYVAYCVVYVILAVLLGMAMARLIELPVLRWRDRVWPSRSMPVDPVPETDTANDDERPVAREQPARVE